MITRSSTLRGPGWKPTIPHEATSKPPTVKKLDSLTRTATFTSFCNPFLRAFFLDQNAEKTRGQPKAWMYSLTPIILNSDQSQPHTSGMNQAQKSRRSTNRVTPLDCFGWGQVLWWLSSGNPYDCRSDILQNTQRFGNSLLVVVLPCFQSKNFNFHHLQSHGDRKYRKHNIKCHQVQWTH